MEDSFVCMTMDVNQCSECMIKDAVIKTVSEFGVDYFCARCYYDYLTNEDNDGLIAFKKTEPIQKDKWFKFT